VVLDSRARVARFGSAALDVDTGGGHPFGEVLVGLSVMAFQ
jgi:hypothetical protein